MLDLRRCNFHSFDKNSPNSIKNEVQYEDHCPGQYTNQTGPDAPNPYQTPYKEANSYYKLESVIEVSEATSLTDPSSNSFLDKGITPEVKVMGTSFVELNTLDVVGESIEFKEQEDSEERV